MEVLDLYSKRQKRRRGEIPGSCTDDLSHELRVKIFLLWEEFDPPHYHSMGGCDYKLSKNVIRCLRKAYGKFRLWEPAKMDGRSISDAKELKEFFLAETDVEKALDIVEAVFTYICDQPEYERESREAIETLNKIFLEHGANYRFADGRIIPTKSEFLYKEAIEPALELIRDPAYKGAQKPFLDALDCYRKGSLSGVLIELNNSLESALEIICNKHGWQYQNPKNPRVSDLVKACFQNNLIPEYWHEHFSELSELLKKGVPPARNKLAAHGRKNEKPPIPPYVIAHALHLTAAAIVFLVNAEKSL